jgi:murein DD-endopeptidase MepM/ murein hydrolase activator NlpD
MANERRIAFSRVAVRLMAAAGAAALMAGCADSSRFSEPFNDPFGASRTVASRPVDQTPTGSLQQTPSYRQASLAPVDARPLPAPASNAHTTSAPSAPVATPSIPGPLPGADPHWTTIGGTPIVMAQGETPSVIANRYGVPTDALVKSNGYASAAAVHPGAKLIIPVYRANANGGALAKAAPIQTPQQLTGGGGVSGKVTEAKTETKSPAAPAMTKAERLAQRQEELKAEREKAAAKLAERKAAQLQAQDELKARKAAELEAKARKQAELKAKADADKAAKAQAKNDSLKYAAARKAGPATETAQALAPAAPVQVAKVEQKVASAAPVSVGKPSNVDTSTTGAINPDVLKPNSATADNQKSAAGEEKRPEFRWPVRGRIIQGFASGGDGINIAVPEGTQVKAVEEGEVAFAGSELKGFGNMILIRHPNGYVSAYAHNSQIDVKRGDKVKRGQTIARSGQTGNVGSPQLHFELRKGSTPVDPTTYLAGL